MIPNNKDHYWWNHSFFYNKQILSPHYEEWIIPIIKKLEFKELIDARCNMMTKESFSYTSELHTDFNIKNGLKEIPIEERDPTEVSIIEGIDENNDRKKIKITPEDSSCKNYAFDITPAKYITKLMRQEDAEE